MELLIASSDALTFSISEAALLLNVNRNRLGHTIDALRIPTVPGPKRSRRINVRTLERLRRHFARLSEDRQDGAL